MDLDGDRILVSTSETSLKARNTKRDARVGVSVVAYDNPYVEAQIRGRVVERRPDPTFEVMDRISRKYTGKDFPWRSDPALRVVLVIDPERAKYAVLPFTHSPVQPPGGEPAGIYAALGLVMLRARSAHWDVRRG